MYQTTLKIDGMMCGMCESHINDTIRKAVPVKKVTSSHAKGEAVVLTDEPLDIEAVKAAVHATGYEVTDASSEPYEKKEVLPFQEVIPFSSYRGKPLCPHAGRAVFHKAGPPVFGGPVCFVLAKQSYCVFIRDFCRFLRREIHLVKNFTVTGVNLLRPPTDHPPHSDRNERRRECAAPAQMRRSHNYSRSRVPARNCSGEA